MALKETTSETGLQPSGGCSLCGDQLSDRMQILRTVFAGCEESRELPDGFAFRFPGDAHWLARSYSSARSGEIRRQSRPHPRLP